MGPGRRPTRSVGGLFPNDGDGNAWGDKEVGFPPVLAKQGYKLVDPGRYQNLTDDFTAQIAAFKQAKAEIVTGVVIPPDFTTFWNQAIQQGFKPKVVSVGKALLFPVGGERWARPATTSRPKCGGRRAIPSNRASPASAAELAKAYETGQRQQWTQPIGFVHSLFEVAVDLLKRVRTPATARRCATASARPSSTPSSARSRWGGQGPFQEHRQDAAGRRPVAARAASQVRTW